MQLNLFSWELEQIAEGYKHLLSYDFEKSIIVFKEVLEKYPDNKEALTESVMAYYWNKIFKQCGNFDDKDDLEYFFMEIVGYDFDNTYSSINFKNSLIKKLIGLMQKKNVFFIQSPVTIADLYIDLNEYESAGRVLTEYLKQHPNDGRQRCRLADMQWLQGEKKEAKQNYALALLHAHQEIEINKIACPELAKIIEKKGTSMAPAYCYMEGILPLLNILSFGIKADNDEQQMAWKIYDMLYRAEKARKNHKKDETIKTRKQLKELDPELYNSYFQWLDRIK